MAIIFAIAIFGNTVLSLTCLIAIMHIPLSLGVLAQIVLAVCLYNVVSVNLGVMCGIFLA